MCRMFVEVRITLYPPHVQITVCFDQCPMKYCIVGCLINDDGTLIAFDDRSPVTTVVDAAANFNGRVLSHEVCWLSCQHHVEITLRL